MNISDGISQILGSTRFNRLYNLDLFLDWREKNCVESAERPWSLGFFGPIEQALAHFCDRSSKSGYFVMNRYDRYDNNYRSYYDR